MSFILDALKKSENERQLNAPPEFATVPADPDSPGAPRWLWVLGGLLLINVVVVIALLTRDTAPAVPATLPEPVAARAPTTVAPAVVPPTTVPADDFADRLDAARRNLPQRAAETEVAAPNAPVTSDRAAAEPAAAPDASSDLLLPSLDELRLGGEVDLPELHVDIHVWSDDASDRFVFINMDKYRERDALAAGPVVREITRDGVVLDYRGRRFMLPRD